MPPMIRLATPDDAEQVPVNEHCLVDDPADAFRLAARFSRPEEGYEPGPYHVVEVWRRGGGTSS